MENQEKPTAKIVTALIVACTIGLVIWIFPMVRSYNAGLVSSGAVIPMPEYHVSDAPAIIAAANGDRAGFEQAYARQTFSGQVALTSKEARGTTAVLIRTTTAGAAPIIIECGMNKFRAAASKDALDSLKPGDSVRVKGVIGAESAGRIIALSDGCTVEKAAAPAPAALPPAK